KTYSQDGTTIKQQWVPNWSVIQDPKEWYLYGLVKVAESKTLDGIPTATTYEYDSTNGQVSKITEKIGVQSDLVGLRDRVTTIDFAYKHVPAMRNSNMLVQVYESADSAVANGFGSVLLSRHRTEYDTSKNRPI